MVGQQSPVEGVSWRCSRATCAARRRAGPGKTCSCGRFSCGELEVSRVHSLRSEARRHHGQTCSRDDHGRKTSVPAGPIFANILPPRGTARPRKPKARSSKRFMNARHSRGVQHAPACRSSFWPPQPPVMEGTYPLPGQLDRSSSSSRCSIRAPIPAPDPRSTTPRSRRDHESVHNSQEFFAMREVVRQCPSRERSHGTPVISS